MKRLSTREAAAMKKAEDIAEAERRRELCWHVMDVRERGRALQLAGLEKERATHPLGSFTDNERLRMRVAIERHVFNMEQILHSLHPQSTPHTQTHWYLH